MATTLGGLWTTPRRGCRSRGRVGAWTTWGCRRNVAWPDAPRRSAGGAGPESRGSSSASCSPVAARARSGRESGCRRRAAGRGEGRARRARRRSRRPRARRPCPRRRLARTSCRSRRASSWPTAGSRSSCRTCAVAPSTGSCGPGGTSRPARSSPCWRRWPRRSAASTTSASSTATSRRATCCSTSRAVRCSATSGSATSSARSRPGSGAPRATSPPRCSSAPTRARHPTSTRSVRWAGSASPGRRARGARPAARLADISLAGPGGRAARAGARHGARPRRGEPPERPRAGVAAVPRAAGPSPSTSCAGVTR